MGLNPTGIILFGFYLVFFCSFVLLLTGDDGW
jgi:hypothetical protein